MRGEFELIDLLRERIAAAGAGAGARVLVGSGDDAAIVRAGGVTATSVDAIVDGVHFRRATFPPQAIGRKAAATALSDLAAMGAGAGEAYVQFGLPSELGEDEAVGIADGLGAAVAAAGGVVAGGDVVASPVLFLAVTVVGHAERAESFVTRAGARPGDALVLTGPVGGAGAGLLLLERPELGAAVDDATAAALRARQLEPRAQLGAGAALAAAGATAMIDVSDGLGADAAHMAAASGVRLAVDMTAVPAVAGAAAVAAAAGEEPEEFVAAAGEDYELLAAVPAPGVEAALGALKKSGLDPALIGGAETGEGLVLRGATGRELNARGYDQLRSRAPAEPS